MAESAVAICNLALSNCENDSQIETIELGNLDPEDIGEEERLCAQWYEPLRQQALRAHEWGFATVDKALTQLSNYTAIDTRWGYGYQFPSDCLKFCRIINTASKDIKIPFRPIFDDRQEWDQRVILCNQDAALGTYIRDVTDPTQFDATFDIAFSWLLAAHICGSLTGSKVNRSHCLTMYGQFMPAAMADDSNEQENDPQPVGEDPMASWHRARL